MFQVEGYVREVSYVVRVGVARTAETGGMERAGIALGTGRVIDVLNRNAGLPVLVTPTGPEVVGSLTDPAGVLAILTAHTEITSITGDDIPQLMPVAEPGVVY